MQKMLVLVLLSFGIQLSSSLVLALEKGKPHTLTRAAWCDDRLKICLNAVSTDCAGKAVSCAVAGTADCQAAFGSGSNCMSRSRLTGTAASLALNRPKIKY